MSRGAYDPFYRNPRNMRRVALGLTQEQLAELARVSVRTVRNWENSAAARNWRTQLNITSVLANLEIERDRAGRLGQVAGFDREGVAGLARSPETGNAGASTK